MYQLLPALGLSHPFPALCLSHICPLLYTVQEDEELQRRVILEHPCPALSLPACISACIPA